jgi:hypothetical protein
MQNALSKPVKLLPGIPPWSRATWLGILMVMVAGIVLGLMFTVFAGGDSVATNNAATNTQQETSTSAPASGPAASATGEGSTTLPSTNTDQETVPPATSPETSSQDVFLSLEAKVNDPFIGTGTYTLQTPQFRDDLKTQALNGGLLTASMFYIIQESADDYSLANRGNEVVGNPAVFNMLGRHFVQDRAPLQAVTIEPSAANVGPAIPDEGLWMCATAHQGWAQGQTHQRVYAIQAIYGIEKLSGHKVWTLINIRPAGGSSTDC